MADCFILDESLLAAATAKEGEASAQMLVGRQLAEHPHQDHSFEGLDQAMGISLVLGFIFMMLVDQLASSMSNGNGSRSPTDAEALVQSSGNLI